MALPIMSPLEGSQVPDAEAGFAGIHRTAARMFSENWPLGCVRAWGLLEGMRLKGALSVIEQDPYMVCYAAIDDDLLTESLLSEIDLRLAAILAQRGERPVYFNLRGDMTSLIADLRRRGFKADTCGYEMVCDLIPGPADDNTLAIRRYEERHGDAYLRLLDGAFNPLAVREGSPPDAFQRGRDRFTKKFSELSQKGDFVAFWQGEDLVGLVTLSEDVIDLLAVHPEFHGRGWGGAILHYATRTILQERGFSDAWLYVTDHNPDARCFYLSHGYRISGFYSENTYGG